jgi:23S rRNA G2445 N2-methylase RlmL
LYFVARQLGESLHNGLSIRTDKSSLNEVLAAGMLKLTAEKDNPIFLSRCAAPNFAFEAALIALKASGIFRSSWLLKMADFDRCFLMIYISMILRSDF